MFSLNESNRFVMSQNSTDMRKGADSLCGEIRHLNLEPCNGDVYVFVNTTRKVMKLLHWERGGFVVYHKRLTQGRFHRGIFLHAGTGFRSLRWDELVLLMEGISPKAARRRRFRLASEEGEKDGKKDVREERKSVSKVWLSR